MTSRRLVDAGSAMLTVAVALGASVLLRDVIAPNFSPLFFAAVAVASWWRGFGAGLLATVLAALTIEWFLVTPYHVLDLTVSSALRLALFAGAALMVNAIQERERQARSSAEQLARTREGLLQREQVLRAEAEAAQRRLAFLAEASRLLAASLAYPGALSEVARLAVPDLADACAVDVIERNGYQRVASARAAADEPPTPAWPPIAMLATPTSSLGLPLVSAGRTLGVLTLAFAPSGRLYDAEEAKLAGDLADRIAIAIDRSRLYQEAETANRVKDDFLGTLSHELRTPLNAVLGWATMLRRGTLGPVDTERGLETIERNARAQVSLMNDLLDVSRIITGRLRLEIREVDLIAVLDDAIGAVRPAAQAKGITIESSFDPQARAVSGDIDRLQQVAWNLVSNAVKFTPERGSVRLMLTRVGGGACLTVADTGRGIGADFLPHVFERFRQAETTRNRTHGGLGLGLAIVRHLVELHGGTVEAESAGEGRGATFRVTLPLRAAERPEATVPEADAAPRS